MIRAISFVVGKRCDRTYIVIHKCSSLCQNCRIIGEGQLINIGAVEGDAAAVVDHPALVINVSNAPNPVPGFLRKFGIRFVFRISSKTRSDIEKAAIGNG